MKKIFSALFLLCFASIATAQNNISLSDVDGRPGYTVTVDVALQNSDDVTAVEVVIPLVAKQLTFVDGSCVMNSERSNGHSISTAVVDGALRVYIYSLTSKVIKGNDGKLFSFDLKLGNAPMEYPLQPTVLLMVAQSHCATHP